MSKRILNVMSRYRLRNKFCLAGAAVLTCFNLFAQQTGTTTSGPTSTVMQLPASGRTQQSSGSVNSQQTTSQSTGADVVQPSVNVTGNYVGSINLRNLPSGPLKLSLVEAVKLGLQANLGTVTANLSSAASRAQRLQALSQLIPQITASLNATKQQVNLATFGFSNIASSGSGFTIPLVPPPFQYVQGQGNLSWNAIDITSIRNYQAAKESERATILNGRDARELVVLAVGGQYLQVIFGAARIDSQRTQLNYAQAVYDQAARQLTAGTNTRIDVSRSLVQLQTEKERLISLQADYDQQKLALARVLGVPLSKELTLTEPVRFEDGESADEMGSLRTAFERRSDLLAAETQVKAAERALSAARSERIPTLSFTGYYGASGQRPNSAHGVFQAQGSVNIPIFDGGKIRGDVREAEATLHQRQAEYEDQKNKVEQDVRNALIQLRSASGEVKLAESNRQYALETLEHARRRFDAGVTNTVEVVQAQQQLGSAESAYFSGLFAYNLARITLAKATGQAESNISVLFTGTRP